MQCYVAIARHTQNIHNLTFCIRAYIASQVYVKNRFGVKSEETDTVFVYKEIFVRILEISDLLNEAGVCIDFAHRDF